MMMFVAALALTVAPAEPTRHEWKVGDVTRQALIYAPSTAKSTPTPVVYAFHGHGGTMQHAARTFAYHKQWPEAICVYMQGLKTPGQLTDPKGLLPGWQGRPGDQDDRDLKFFDVVLKWLHDEYKVDDKRIYSTGHSNGGGFTYLLWGKRGDVFAAVAPSAAVAPAVRNDLKPKPVLHVAGEKDELVKYSWQKLNLEALKKLNGCSKDGTAWETKGMLYPSPGGTPVITYIHPGDHKFPSDAPELIVKFFKQYEKK